MSIGPVVSAVTATLATHRGRRGHGARLCAAAAAALAAIAPSAAHAYLDPGHAYLALQGALGIIAALGATLALYRDRVRAWLRRPPRERTKAEPSKREEGDSDEFEQ